MSTEPLGEEELNPDWWYYNGKAYDFGNFVSSHPGGESAISLGKGRDCTALFESYHTRLPSTDLLLKYRINKDDDDNNKKNVADINNVTFSYKNSGFYRTVKQRALEYFIKNGYRDTKGGV
eukprot:530312_1